MPKLTIPRADVIVLIDLLDSFEKLCTERKIKFSKYTAEEIMQFLQLYKAYKKGEIDPPPFDGKIR